MKRLMLLAAAAALCTFQHDAAAASVQPQAEQMSELPPLYADELARAKNFVDEMMAEGLVVPLPKDPGGGYTHEQHKRNYKAIYLGGQIYRVTGDEAYRDYARDMLLEYAEMYPKLGDHPAKANQNVGRLFWQVLNDAMWLVHAVQGYGDIRDTLTSAERAMIDDNVFRPAAKFLSVDSERTFNLIHNHATWATAGVGMTGYLLGDRDMVDRALLGSDKSGETGFIRQTELLFSPDGYYTEGPYYQRFALLPFLVFADAIERNEPERKIFEHRDGILLKALRTTVQLSYRGYFFPFNDAIRDKSLKTAELYDGIAIAYAQTGDPSLLSVAEFQDRTVLSKNGMMVASDLAAGKAKPFPFKSLMLSDGPEGKQGAVAVLRDGPTNAEGEPSTALIAKNTSQGMGHGHFDKLAWQMYDNGNEIVRDYGAARFLNIVAKEGGRYLPENETWAKSSIAHNTLVVDEKSHFDGDVKLASAKAPSQLYFSDADGLQVSSGRIAEAYPGVLMQRTLIVPDIPGLEAPVVLDLVRGRSRDAHQYDLPLHYSGHIMEFDFAVDSNVEARPVLGEANGYQHIWVDAQAKRDDGKGALTWILDGRFYTYRFAGNGPIDVVLGETGANDPNFNLRREPLIMLRASRENGQASFASLLEAHGKYDGAAEQTVASRSRVADLDHSWIEGVDIVRLTLKSGQRFAIAVSHQPDPEAAHSVTIDGETIAWTGFAAVVALTDEGN
ncbi:alginate lyase family protein [Erythrobacter crassostreae]|uniref:Alginate lyase family protein n=1 Tax=Erythrobacter crassostreae TaxID=2828328 RepID=A0A9X1F4Z1_9SPHN|nr:alginate lyase family protein [Erythrobacter crassostrea]MBV7260326.1 alginate lyase family protein [Erythrobacter crassostrea]